MRHEFGQEWTGKEDARILFLRRHGCPWADVAIDVGRSKKACKARYARLVVHCRVDEKRRKLLERVDATVEIRERADKAREILRKLASQEVSDGMEFAKRFHKMNVAGSNKLLARLRMARELENRKFLPAKPEPVKPRFVALQDAWGL